MKNNIGPKWIWFAKRQVPFFQNDTEPKLFPEQYEKYIPLSHADQREAELNKEIERLKMECSSMGKLIQSGVVIKTEEYSELIAVIKLLTDNVKSTWNFETKTARREFAEEALAITNEKLQKLGVSL